MGFQSVECFAPEHRFRAAMAGMKDGRFAKRRLGQLAEEIENTIIHACDLSTDRPVFVGTLRVQIKFDPPLFPEEVMEIEFVWAKDEKWALENAGHPWMGSNAVEAPGDEDFKLVISSLKTNEAYLRLLAAAPPTNYEDKLTVELL